MSAASTPPSSPFIAPNASVGKVMRTVLYALAPGIVLYAWLFGWGVLVNIAWTALAALGFEALMLLLRQRPLRPFLTDGSALVTAVLLALALPPLAPWWIAVLGAFFAIVVAKQLYGGLGFNAFNPAMAAYAVLLISFPLEMSQWSVPLALSQQPLSLAQALEWSLFGRLPAGLSFDALTAATPLDHLRTEVGRGRGVAEASAAPVFGRVAGRGSEWVSLAFAAGGVWLLLRGLISWHIPAAVIASIALVSGTAWLFDPAAFAAPPLHLIGGATLLGAFFIATDPVTAPATPVGKLIYGAGIGVLTFAIRSWGAYPDGIAFAVLLMGLSVPLLDHYTVPKVFGARRRRGSG